MKLPHPEQAPELLIATWNVGGANTIRSTKQFDYEESNPGYFLEQLRTLGPDILCLQEIPFDGDVPEASFVGRVESELGMESCTIICHPNHISKSPTSQLGIGIFSTLPIIERERIELPYPDFALFLEDGRPAVRHDKYLQGVEITTGDGPCIVATTHNQSLSYPRLADGRRPSYHEAEGAEYATEVDRVMFEILKTYTDNALIVAADLNTDDADRAFPETFDKLELKEALKDAGPTRMNGTHTDYILRNAHVEVMDAGIIHTDKADHYLLWNKIRL